jgi:hypothetical protein
MRRAQQPLERHAVKRPKEDGPLRLRGEEGGFGRAYDDGCRTGAVVHQRELAEVRPRAEGDDQAGGVPPLGDENLAFAVFDDVKVVPFVALEDMSAKGRVGGYLA